MKFHLVIGEDCQIVIPNSLARNVGLFKGQLIEYEDVYDRKQDTDGFTIFPKY